MDGRGDSTRNHPEILDEYRRVGLELSKGREPLVSAVESLLAMLTVHAMLVSAPPLGERVSGDPDDDMFLAAARAANVRVIVSGDKHLLSVSGWQRIEVLKLRRGRRWVNPLCCALDVRDYDVRRTLIIDA